MLNSLAKFDPITAAGILARTAAFIDDEWNPSVREGRVEDEVHVRASVLRELRARLGVSENELSSDIRHRLAAELDAESESLLTPVDEGAVLESLGEKGALPSDLYRIHFDEGLKNNLSIKFEIEAQYIQDTVREAEREQHFDAAGSSGRATLISLFSRFYPNPKFPGRGFTFLVAGQRRGLDMNVTQSWRLYADLIDVSSAKDLLGVLKLFTDHFGYPVRIGDWVGSFLQLDIPEVDGVTRFSVEIERPKNKGERIATYQFGAKSKAEGTVKLIAMGVNVGKYLKLVNSRGW